MDHAMKTYMRELTRNAASGRGLHDTTRTQHIQLYFCIDSNLTETELSQILRPHNFKAKTREKQTDLFPDVPAQSHWLLLAHVTMPDLSLAHVMCLLQQITRSPLFWRVVNPTREAQKTREGSRIFSQKEIWSRFPKNAGDKNRYALTLYQKLSDLSTKAKIVKKVDVQGRKEPGRRKWMEMGKSITVLSSQMGPK